MRRLTRHSNWIKVYVKPSTRHALCKISVENFNFLLDNFFFFYLKFCLKNLQGAKIKLFLVLSLFSFTWILGKSLKIDISKTLRKRVKLIFYTLNHRRHGWVNSSCPVLWPFWRHNLHWLPSYYPQFSMTSFKMTVCIKVWNNFFKILLFCIPMQLIHFDCVNGFLNSIKEMIWQTEVIYHCPLIVPYHLAVACRRHCLDEWIRLCNVNWYLKHRNLVLVLVLLF